MNLDKSLTRLTLDRTTPDEFAIAFLLNIFSDGVVTSATAHRRTTIGSMTSSIALTIFGAQRTDASVVFTEVRVFEVDQIVFGRSGETAIART